MAAACRFAEPGADAVVVNHEQGWRLGHPEPCGELGTLVHIDAHEFEGVVILAVLENLGEEAFRSS